MSGPSCCLSFLQTVVCCLGVISVLRATCQNPSLLVCTKPVPGLGMALLLARHTAQPGLGLVHSPCGHSELAPNPAPVLCPHRCPRQQPTSWPTVRPTSGTTLSSSPCLRPKTPSERRSSFVPSSDSVGGEAPPVLSVPPGGDPHAGSFRDAPPVPTQPQLQGGGSLCPLVSFIALISLFLSISVLFSLLAKKPDIFLAK